MQRQFLGFSCYPFSELYLIYCYEERKKTTERTEQDYASQTPNKKETISISFEPAENSYENEKLLVSFGYTLKNFPVIASTNLRNIFWTKDPRFYLLKGKYFDKNLEFSTAATVLLWKVAQEGYS